MKCPKCGAWNAAYLPKCGRCGAPLSGNTQKPAAWEEAMHKKKPSLTVIQFESQEQMSDVPDKSTHYDPDCVDPAGLTDEVEELLKRRDEGSQLKAQMKEHAERMRQSIREAQIIRPLPENADAQLAADHAVIRRRQQLRQEEYLHAQDGASCEFPEDKDEPLGYFGDPLYEQPITYVDDAKAPIFYDGFTPESGDQGALTDEEYLPRRVQTRPVREDPREYRTLKKRKKLHPMRILLRVLLLLCCCALVVVGGVFAARTLILRQSIRVSQDNQTQIEVRTSMADGHPAHTLTIYGRENATIFLRETQTSYVIANGKVEITIPDYMWYDTESSTFATPVETDTMQVHITPFVRYSQEGEQYQLDPVEYEIDVPLSPIRLISPSTTYTEVGVSIYEVRINVELGSTVIIDGTNVSTLIRAETGNVSRNVQVLPVGENTISISVKSKYCRENKMEITLYRAPQEIPLELDATVLVEWNYEPISEEKYTTATDEERTKMNIPSISGTTLPGATVTVEFPHWGLEVDSTTGKFTFHPLFSALGNNDVPIRASYEGREDSVITHTVYYMPNADIYTRRAWDLNSQYTDLINYISMRKGTIYTGTGTIKRIISTTPQLAVMDIGTESMEKLVLLENSSKTTWTVGTKYRIYGEAYGLYDTMPRLTVRYTYLTEN